MFDWTTTSYLSIDNRTSKKIVKVTATEKDSSCWDENSSSRRPSAALGGKEIDAFDAIRGKMELYDGYGYAGIYDMTLEFEDGSSVSFTNNQKDAYDDNDALYKKTDQYIIWQVSANTNGFLEKGLGHSYPLKYENLMRIYEVGHEPPPLESWMKNIPDNRKITELAIPGSHDSGTYGNAKRDNPPDVPCDALSKVISKLGVTVTNEFIIGISRCQDKTIKEQLMSGIRYFDLRGYAIKDGKQTDSEVWHSDVRFENKFSDIFRDIIDFLKENPSEVVFVQLKSESGNGGGSGKALADVVTYIREHNFNDSEKNIFDIDKDWKASTPAELPSIGECRGKLMILDRMSDTLGLTINKWGDNKITDLDWYCIQDCYFIESGFTGHLALYSEKAEYIRNFHHNYANNNSDYKDRPRLNFVSVALPPFIPPTFGLPMMFSTTLNERTASYLRSQIGNYGSVFLMDGVGSTSAKKLVREIIDANNFSKKS